MIDVENISKSVSTMLGRQMQFKHFPPQAVVCPLSHHGDTGTCQIASDFWIGNIFVSFTDAIRVISIPLRGNDRELTWDESSSLCQELNDRCCMDERGYRFALPTQPQFWLGASLRENGNSWFENGPPKHVEYCIDSLGSPSGSALMQCGPLRPDLRATQFFADGKFHEPGYTGTHFKCGLAGFRLAIHDVANGTAVGSPFGVKHGEWRKILTHDDVAYGDVKLFPGGKREWDWVETEMHHSPGVGIIEVEELLAWGARTIVIGNGFQEKLQVKEELMNYLASKNMELHVHETSVAIILYNAFIKSNNEVGALIHSTC